MTADLERRVTLLEARTIWPWWLRHPVNALARVVSPMTVIVLLFCIATGEALLLYFLG